MTKYVLVSQGIKIAETFDQKWAEDYTNIRNKELDEYNVKCVESGDPPVDNYIHLYTEEVYPVGIELTDKFNRDIHIDDIIEVTNECDVIYPEEVTKFTGRVVFCCGCFGIGTDDTIPELYYGNNDNFVTFYELYDKLNLCEFSDLSEYLITYKENIENVESK